VVFFCFAGGITVGIVRDNAWNPQSYYWHSDLLWGEPGSLAMEAQERYEVPIKVALDLWGLGSFAAAVGMLWRSCRARRLFILLQVLAVVGVCLCDVLLWRLGMAEATDHVATGVVVALLCMTVWKLMTPAIVLGFHIADQ
jgi:hypothetical protein